MKASGPIMTHYMQTSVRIPRKCKYYIQ